MNKSKEEIAWEGLYLAIQKQMPTEGGNLGDLREINYLRKAIFEGEKRHVQYLKDFLNDGRDLVFGTQYLPYIAQRFEEIGVLEDLSEVLR